jgi:hypothetical protein
VLATLWSLLVYFVFWELVKVCRLYNFQSPFKIKFYIVPTIVFSFVKRFFYLGNLGTINRVLRLTLKIPLNQPYEHICGCFNICLPVHFKCFTLLKPLLGDADGDIQLPLHSIKPSLQHFKLCVLNFLRDSVLNLLRYIICCTAGLFHLLFTRKTYLSYRICLSSILVLVFLQNWKGLENAISFFFFLCVLNIKYTHNSKQRKHNGFLFLIFFEIYVVAIALTGHRTFGYEPFMSVCTVNWK